MAVQEQMPYRKGGAEISNHYKQCLNEENAL